MAEQSKARPRWTQDNGLHVSVERNGKWRRVPDDQVSPRVRERVLGQLDGTKQTRADDLTAEMIEHGTIPVEFDWEKNFKRVRIPGEAWVEPDHPIEQATTPVGPITAEPSRFLNPYGFVSTEPRGNDLDPAWQDRPPTSHASAASGGWTGRITVKGRALTPLLFIDDATSESERIDGKVHRTYGVRRTVEGGPELPVTSLKGALRAAYEAITSSRFGVWSEDGNEPLAYREPAGAGAGVVPIRIDEVPTNKDEPVSATLFEGQMPDVPAPKLQAAAWLPALPRGGVRPVQVTLDGGASRPPNHGEELWAELQLIRHHDRGRRPNNTFHMWRVTKLAATVEALTQARPVAVTTRDVHNRSWYEAVSGVNRLVVQGWVVLTGDGIDTKHDERFAFNGRSIKVDRGVVGSYDAILRSYLAARSSNAGTPPPLENDPRAHIADQRRHRAAPGLWAFARLTGQRVADVVPVHIGRAPWKTAPVDLAARDRLVPAASLSELSAADRVFGWVAGSGNGDDYVSHVNHKGQLRIQSIRCTNENPASQVVDLPEPVPLAILGQPKPAQGRFYSADQNGKPHADGERKPNLYQAGSRLRGRKFYWHHAGEPTTAHYWSTDGPYEGGDRGWFQEFLAAGGARSDQNRSICSWIDIGTTFEIEIDVVNLSDAELGALLWLVSKVPGASVRAGYGKPFGFGSLELRLDRARTVLLRSADLVTYRYLSLSGQATPAVPVDDLISAFTRAASRRSLQQYRVMAAGVADLRVHYPRVSNGIVPPPPDPKGENFRWFVNNERTTGNQPPPMSLPDVESKDPSLPYL